MGRVSKFKKIKKVSVDCDGIWGFGDNGAKPKKRSRTAEKLRQQKINRRLKRMKDSSNNTNSKYQRLVGRGKDDGFNRPPSDNEDEFDMDDMQGSLKKQNQDTSIVLYNDTDNIDLPTVKSSADSNNRIANNKMIDQKKIKEAEQLLRGTDSATTTTTTTSGKVTKFEGRKEGESKRAYNRRVKDETRSIIKQTTMKGLNPEKRKRKKEFLNQKKKRKRSSTPNNNNNNNNNRRDDDDDGFAMPVDEVPFGHQVERPPEFKSLPRGAFSSAGKKKATASNNKKKTMKTDQDVRAEQENLEKMRKKVQEQYAMIKAKRKRAGDFHL